MLNLCERLSSGEADKKEVQELIRHPDYQFEFSRYEGRVSEEEYINYLMQAANLSEDQITNADLKAHHKYYRDLFNNPEFYKKKLTELETILKPDIFNEQLSIALKGLPDDLELDELSFVFTIGIGQSFGYAHGNGMHFDFLQLAKEKSIEEFRSTISHEIHHVVMYRFYDKLNVDALSLESQFYVSFSAEGLAVKYCNNAEGIMSKSIYEGSKNIGLDAFTWQYLNNDFENTMAHFMKDVEDIRGGRIKSQDELNKLLIEYWMNPRTEEQSESDIPKLLHFRLYSFGNEIWGIIHDCFGKNAVYETLMHPEAFPSVYNNALEKLGYGQYKI
jgi:uncharacterized protein YjaZ